MIKKLYPNATAALDGLLHDGLLIGSSAFKLAELALGVTADEVVVKTTAKYES